MIKRLSLAILILVVGAYCFSHNRMDNNEMESDSLVRMARSASSSEEDNKENNTDKELKKVTPEHSGEVEGSGDVQRETRQIQIADPLQEGSGSLGGIGDFHPRTTRETELEASGQEPTLRVLKDLPLEGSGEEIKTLRDAPLEGSGDILENSRFFARLADSPLEEGSGEALGQRFIRSESSGDEIEANERVARDVEGSGVTAAESIDGPVEGSGDVQPTRVSRDIAEGSGIETAALLDAEGSGELLSSQHIRVIREEGSGLAADE